MVTKGFLYNNEDISSVANYYMYQTSCRLQTDINQVL